MARLNFSSPNEFASGGHRGPTPDNLLEMLQQSMQAQTLQRQRPGYMPRPGASPADDSSPPPGGLFGRWLELQAARQQPQPFAGDRGQMPSAPADPNVRRLVRVSPPVQPQGGAGVSNRPSYSAFGDSIPSDVLSASYHGSGESGADTERPAPVIAGFPQIRRSTTMPPMGPGTLPSIPMPQIPEWLKVIGRVLQFDPRTWSGGGGNDAYRRCIKAAGGSTEDWEEFCNSLGHGQNNTLGGESQKRACWAKTFETETNKRLWCSNQFGNH
jgi:hypothetical protein